MAGSRGPRLVTLRRDDHCVACTRPVAVGEQAWWQPESRSVTCTSCAGVGSGLDGVVPVARRAAPADRAAPARRAGRAGGETQAGQAGASASREYERRRHRHRQALEDDHPVMGRVLDRWRTEPSSTRAWSRGAAGERRVGELLDQVAATTGAVVLHDRRLPRRRANIDHLVVTAAAVWVIDTKNHHGGVGRRPQGGPSGAWRVNLQVAGRDRRTIIDGVNRQVDAVWALLSPVWPGLPVMGCACFLPSGWWRWWRPFTIEGVHVHRPATLRRALGAATPAVLGAEGVATVASQLAAELPPA